MSLLETALERYSVELPKRILSYQEHRSVDRLLGDALEITGQLLNSMARFIGFLDGLNEDFSAVPEIQDKLRTEGLTEWSQRYALELRRLWKSFGKWSSFEAFTDLNIHVERLMWRHGLFIWPEGLGVQVRVMPPAFEFNSLIKSVAQQFVRNSANPDDIELFDQLNEML